MSWSKFTEGLQRGFSGGSCRTQGRRYPGCPLHKIEAAIAAGGLSEFQGQILGELAGELQQRGYVPPPLPAPQPPPQPGEDGHTQRMLAECREVIEELLAQGERDRQTIARKQETIDRFAAAGTRYKALLAESDALLKNPRVLDAARKAALADTHPDRAKGIEHQQTLTLTFQEQAAAFDRIRDRLKVER